MSVNLYAPFTHPITGETFKCTFFDENCYRMEWSVVPRGYVAMEHIHYFQDETFYVKSGELKLVIDGIPRIVKPGESWRVMMDKAHIAVNNSDELLECVVEYNPGLDYFTFFQCFIGLNMDGVYNKKGEISIPKMAYFMAKTKCRALARPTSVPKPMFNFVLKFFGVVGMFAGWNKQLERYVG